MCLLASDLRASVCGLLVIITFGFWVLSLCPAGITLHDESLDWAAAGDHVSLTVTGMDIIKIK